MSSDLELLLAELDYSNSELELQSYLINKKLLEDLAVECTYESNALEGSRLTQPETELAIKIGLTISGKSMSEYLAAINHNQAIQFIREKAEDQIFLSEALIKEIHSILLRGINTQAGGVYRTQPITYASVKNSAPPERIPELMKEEVEWLRLDGTFLHPVIYAAEIHQRILALQPFADANGACARLLMNMVLLEYGYPLTNIRGNAKSRAMYFKALEYAGSHEDKTMWYRLIAEHVMANIKSLLSRINDQQEDL